MDKVNKKGLYKIIEKRKKIMGVKRESRKLLKEIKKTWCGPHMDCASW